jgi:hypothetical protein
MVFGRQRPEKISAVGRFYETGVDDTVSMLFHQEDSMPPSPAVFLLSSPTQPL